MLIKSQLSMAVLAGTTSGGPNTSTSAGIAAAVFLFVFNSFFAVGWLGMTWLYPGIALLSRHHRVTIADK
jgi:hypothetical protein